MDLPKAYIPAEFEADIYALWEGEHAFTPKKAPAKDSFSMTLPPPNANANLHMGHALDFQLKDTIGRYQRMQGKQVLMLPGADHAGFETWYVYEKKLEEQGKSRFDFSREELYRQVWDFVEQNRGNMENQIRAFGISCDWSRSTFTLDDKIINRAYETFKKMWQDRLIYRGERLVNYCTKHGTSFSDIEVAYEDRTTPLYYMKYGPFTLATTRPETKFGDTAVAVHPEDERYKDLVGKEIEVEGLNGPFKLTVVADEMVDREFGTGAVKITPAHDFNDWEVAQRHNLPAKTVINLDGTMNELAGKFAGMSVLEARKAVVKALEEKGLLVKVDEKYQNRVGTCYKCGTVIEPLLLEQWFVSMKPLAEEAIKHLKKGEISLYPKKKLAEIIAYLSDIKDWNISRQIAWGIPIPVFQNTEDPDDWIFDTRVEQSTIEVKGRTYRRDPDVFDTWWSSGQWPYATLEYPSADSSQFYPTSLMETGSDLLRQWVSRMIVLGYYVTKQPPFKQIYFHGMIVDENGAKMSKSKGNVVNPMDTLEEYGSDALRLGLINGTTAGNNQPYSVAKIVGGRNFCNKLWNIARFSQTIVANVKPSCAPKTPADHWIVGQLNQTIATAHKHMQAYRVGEAYDAIYSFVWNDFADWYIEASKTSSNPALLGYILEACLKLAHPFAPFVTEAIWQTLHQADNQLLMLKTWPEPHKIEPKLASEFAEVKAIIGECRQIISTLKANNVTLYYKNSQILNDNAQNIGKLAKLNGVVMVEEGKGLNLTQTNIEAWLDIDSQTARNYARKLEEQLKQVQDTLEKLRGRLANKAYLKNAPKTVVQQTKDQLAELESNATKMQSEIDRYSI
ncbi:valine--tRNA ligase [Candidatus Saccharibacteria bacterium]|nr:valine--tRNA ligase [Candidatus Saccharibacteria bacterium]MCB9821144.1 valine--tRNA ligase [Candidatus Nomurabacteria bacterium]